MIHIEELAAPWSLRFVRDGIEDVAVIYDAYGNELARSLELSVPSDGNPVTRRHVAMRLMATSAELYDALRVKLAPHVRIDAETGIKVIRVEDLATANALKALKKASWHEPWGFL